MAKVLPFSRTFPAYHPKAGKPTFFVEKILKQQGVNYLSEYYMQQLLHLNTINIMKGKLSFEDIESFHLSLQPQENLKHHTIRAGSRFISGDMFNPRCWFGKPYNSPQIIFWKDIEVKKTWDFKIKDNQIMLKGYSIYHYADVAFNDGLSGKDFMEWFQFPKPFSGEIICWSDKVNY